MHVAIFRAFGRKSSSLIFACNDKIDVDCNIQLMFLFLLLNMNVIDFGLNKEVSCYFDESNNNVLLISSISNFGIFVCIFKEPRGSLLTRIVILADR